MVDIVRAIMSSEIRERKLVSTSYSFPIESQGKKRWRERARHHCCYAVSRYTKRMRMRMREWGDWDDDLMANTNPLLKTFFRPRRAEMMKHFNDKTDIPMSRILVSSLTIPSIKRRFKYDLSMFERCSIGLTVYRCLPFPSSRSRCLG